jgi:hypothetical protein
MAHGHHCKKCCVLCELKDLQRTLKRCKREVGEAHYNMMNLTLQWNRWKEGLGSRFWKQTKQETGVQLRPRIISWDRGNGKKRRGPSC